MNITIINDSEDEQDLECFAFAITTLSSEEHAIDTSQTTVCIIDDDGMLVYLLTNISKLYIGKTIL